MAQRFTNGKAEASYCCSLSRLAARWGKRFAMGHNVVLIGGLWLVATVAVWLVCRWRGYTVAAWVAPLTISAFCLGLFVGAHYTTKGRLRFPFLSGHHHRHLVHHARS
jgi:hypothetical protein